MALPGPCPRWSFVSSPLHCWDRTAISTAAGGWGLLPLPAHQPRTWVTGRSWGASTGLPKTIMLLPFTFLSLSPSPCNTWESSRALPLFEGGQRWTQSCSLPPLQQQERGLTGLRSCRRRIARTEKNRIAGKGQMWASIVHFLMSDAFNRCWH